ncbi:MAG: DUF2933 domain-containing protein [Geminicoccaceae bacterium]
MPDYAARSGHWTQKDQHRPLLLWIGLTLAVVLGFFLLTEHRAHLFGALPFLLVLLCPLMHLFMHHGHGRHMHEAGTRPDTSPNREVRP